MSAAERVSKTSSAKQVNERAVRANEQTDERLSSGFLVDLAHSEMVCGHCVWNGASADSGTSSTINASDKRIGDR